MDDEEVLEQRQKIEHSKSEKLSTTSVIEMLRTNKIGKEEQDIEEEQDQETLIEQNIDNKQSSKSFEISTKRIEAPYNENLNEQNSSDVEAGVNKGK